VWGRRGACPPPLSPHTCSAIILTLPTHQTNTNATTGSILGVRDLVTKWLAGFLEVGSLVKRLDVGEGSYAIELEEDYRVYDALGQVGLGGGS